MKEINIQHRSIVFNSAYVGHVKITFYQVSTEKKNHFDGFLKVSENENMHFLVLFLTAKRLFIFNQRPRIELFESTWANVFRQDLYPGTTANDFQKPWTFYDSFF